MRMFLVSVYDNPSCATTKRNMTTPRDPSIQPDLILTMNDILMAAVQHGYRVHNVQCCAAGMPEREE